MQRRDLRDDHHSPTEDPRRTRTRDRPTEDEDVHARRDPADERADLEDEDGEHDDVFRREDLVELGVDQVEAEQSEATGGRKGKKGNCQYLLGRWGENDVQEARGEPGEFGE